MSSSLTFQDHLPAARDVTTAEVRQAPFRRRSASAPFGAQTPPGAPGLVRPRADWHGARRMAIMSALSTGPGAFDDGVARS
jgi:hypothetical protein